MNEQKCTLTPRISYTNLDIAKFICSLLVVMIHTAPFVDYPIAHFYTVNVVARTAVPLFFAVSGFLLFGRMTYENGKLVDSPQNRSRMLQYLKKTVRLYILWAVFYLLVLLPDWYLSGWWGWVAVKDAVYAFLIKGTFAHLWYLLAVIWAIPILYMLLRVVPLRTLRVIAAVLWFSECLYTTYSWLGCDRIAFMTFLAEKLPVVFSSTRCALPLMTFGASLGVIPHPRPAAARLRRVLLFGGIWILEASAIYFSVPGHNHFSSVLVSPFFIHAVLDFLISGKQIPVPAPVQRIMRETNLIIYCLHPLVIHLLKKTGMGSGIPLWLLTTVGTVGLAYTWAQIKSSRVPARK